MFSLRLSPLQHFVSFVAAVLLANFLVFGTAAQAQTRANGPTFRAELVQPAADSRVVAGGVVWSCSGNACTAGRATSRPAIVCARFAREAGTVASFSVAGEALNAEALARCNASAS